MKVRTTTVIAVCIVLTGCVKEGERSRTSPPSAKDQQSARSATNPVAQARMAGWQQFEFGGLSFRVPPGTTKVPVRGIDSLVGRWDYTNISLHFDFGLFASMSFGPEATALQVAGHAGKMVTTVRTPHPRSATRGSVAQPFASFTNIAEIGVPNGPNGQYLRITFYYREPSDMAVVQAILDSVRY